MFTTSLLEKAERLLEDLRGLGLKIATAESCTGGLIAGLLTEIPGSSDVVERGFVTYSNEAKSEMLGVDEVLIERFGAVSPEVARAMAEGALRQSRAQIAVSVTGVAGPGGGTPAKPVGLVHFAMARTGRRTVDVQCLFPGRSRQAIRLASVAAALDIVAGAINQKS